ncbi:hypothetical protein NIES2100_27030 [Calothrix sp. NIES-2100]|nr:hypothetical protein NIES2100_27030 [Calothrix sp. NIES-2100]
MTIRLNANLIHGLLLTLLSSVAYGTVAILIKLAYSNNMQVMDILLVRYVVATICVFIFSIWKNPSFLRIKRSAFWKIIIVSSLFFIQSLLFYQSLKYLPVSTTVLIVYLNPVLISLFSILLLKKRISHLFIAALVLVIVGSSFIFFDAFSRQLNILGIGLAIATLIISAFSWIVVEKSLREINPLSSLFYTFLFMAILFGFNGRVANLLSWNANQLVVGFSLGLVPTAMSGICFYLAIEKIGVAYASLFSSFEPVFALIAAYFFLKEDIVNYQWIGSLLIVAGIILPNLTRNDL